jgi:cobyrinic acid a,c-diamide synthase
MGGEAHCRELLSQAAQTADLILIEGVMGLFDGAPSSADLAVTFGIPVLAVIDAGAMAQTFGALAHGLSSYRADLPFAGVLANRVASTGHADMLKTSVRADTHYYGAVFRDADMTLPERHLGLVQADEIADLDVRLDLIASKFADTDLAQLPPVVTFTAPPVNAAVPALLQGVRIAVARDDAFAFIYPANLDTLRELGATLSFFSPLVDTELPPADALYLPGGYPELHLDSIANNTQMRDSIRQHHTAGKPIVAECGGMLALLDSLTDKNGKRAEMMGIMAGDAVMQPRLTALALQTVTLPAGTLRGHTYHHSRLTTELAPIALGACPNGYKTAEAVYRIGNLTASYIHAYFPSNPLAVAVLFQT